MKHHLALGKSGERIARRYLEKKGYHILDLNWRFSRAEIDIIAKKDGWLIFVEVKTRSGTFYGRPEEFVGYRKIQLLTDAAIVYMDKSGYAGEFRFDIIAVVIKNHMEYGVKHYKDAFFPGSEGFM